MKKWIFSFILIPLLMTAACDMSAQSSGEKAAAGPGVHPVISAGNSFAFDLYKRLAEKDGNVFFSPYSITVALAMTYEGARAATEEEMSKVLKLPKDAAARRDFFSRDIKRMSAEYGVDMANAFWAQNGFWFLADYKKLLTGPYQAGAFSADFKTAYEKARLDINSWTQKKTRGKIKDLFPRDSLDSMTRLVLVSAVYFKGAWEAQFDKRSTADADFFVSPGNGIKVKMMKRAGESAKFKYSRTPELEALEMPYKGGKLSMLVLLPAEGGLKKLEKGLSPEKLDQWRGGLSRTRVDVFIPRFVMTARYSLPDTLAKMGMPLAFTNAADFSGMDGAKDLYIQQVVHQGFVEVNEEGTEAAAATGVAMGLKSMPMMAPQFRADRPFLFLIQETDSGKILFMGRVEKP